MRDPMFQLTSDEIRELILEFLFSIHQKAGGVKSTALTISKIKRALKQKGLKERDIVSNLDYLIQTEWVLEERETYPITSGGRQIMAQRITL